MKRLGIAALSTILFLLNQSEAQSVHEQIAQSLSAKCGAPVANEGLPSAQQAKRIWEQVSPLIQRLYPQYFVGMVVIQSPAINAWNTRAGYANPRKSLICFPTGMVDLLRNDGEIAFIMAHEAGHGLDDVCISPEQIHKQLSTVRTCEMRADSIGLDILVKAGFSAYEAAGAFGKLEMYQGDVGTGLGARLASFSSDHPITPDRIDNLRRLFSQYCQTNPGTCQ
jgi:Zn-dependent protease with chaperone function